MFEAPGVIDTWVNLLRPGPEHQRTVAENVFGRYGQLDVENALRALRLER